MDGEDTYPEVGSVRKKGQKRVNDGPKPAYEKPLKKICVALTKPSRIRGLNNVRTEHRGRLIHIFRKLMRQHNWKEASGVLSVLLKGTCKERCPTKNRMKYWVALELVHRIGNYHISLAKIKQIYEIWMRKNGFMKNSSVKDKYVIQLEFALFCLTQGNIEDAHQAIICLVQENEYDSDPILNMIVGLISYQLWYSALPEEMKLNNSDTSETPMPSGAFGTRFNNQVDIVGHNAVDSHDVDFPVRCDSDTSVRNDKGIPLDADSDLQKEKSPQVFHPRAFYMEESAEISGREEAFFSIPDENLFQTSIFLANEGLDKCLLPMQLPQSNENLEESIYLHRQQLNDYYSNAVKHLQIALYSDSPVLAALLPLIQLLLLGDQVNEALKELEKFCCDSSMILPIRLRASLLECFDSQNTTQISSCYEVVLKKDPTCSHSLTRLISMHKHGDYSLEPLLEMIALHLDATYGACSVWEELAECFLKLPQYEEDRFSVCGNHHEHRENIGFSIPFHVLPNEFITGKSGRSWKFRCRWWSTRHFSTSVHTSEIQVGDHLQLLTFKAACASHMYGPEFEYVLSVRDCLQKEENKDKLLYLQKHINNSLNLHENLSGAR